MNDQYFVLKKLKRNSTQVQIKYTNLRLKYKNVTVSFSLLRN